MSTCKTLIVAAAAGVAIVTLSVLTGPASAAENPNQMGVVSPRAVLQAQSPNAFPGPLPHLPRRPVPAPALRVHALGLHVEPGRLPDVANKAAIEPATCPGDALAWGLPVVCGYVPVPLDWAHPGKLGKIKIYFELYTHLDPVPRRARS